MVKCGWNWFITSHIICIYIICDDTASILYIYIYIHIICNDTIYVCIYICLYIYIERERLEIINRAIYIYHI